MAYQLTPSQQQKLQWAKEQFNMDQFGGLTTFQIKQKLQEAGLDQKTIRAFGDWYVHKGLDGGWLLDELGF